MIPIYDEYIETYVVSGSINYMQVPQFARYNEN